jgi:photosystem II stability/assembly factor-like uncharacterized protein
LNWTLQLSTGKYMRSVEFFDENTAIAASLEKTIYRTTDGGDTWVNIIDSFPEEVIGICGLDVVNDHTIFGCGNVLEPAFILRSNDLGVNWEYQDMTGYAKYLIDIYFLNEDTGFCAGLSKIDSAGAILLKTTDGGSTWNPVFYSNEYTDTFWKIMQVNHQTLVMSIENFGSANLRYARSDDRGNSWTIKEVAPIPEYVQMIGFFNDSIGFTGNNVMYETYDGGNTWQKNDSLANETVDRYFKVRDGLAYVSGTHIYKLEDTTVVYTGQAVNHPLAHDSSQWLSQVVPNPAGRTFSFSYGLKIKSRIYLMVIDSKGKTVDMIYHNWQYPGQYTVSRNCNYPAGVYTLLLYTYGGLAAQKFIAAGDE